MKIKQHALAAPSAGRPNAVGKSVDDFGMSEIIGNQVRNLQGHEPSASAAPRAVDLVHDGSEWAGSIASLPVWVRAGANVAA